MPVSAWSTSGAKYARACKESNADLNRFSSPAMGAPYYRVTIPGQAEGDVRGVERPLRRVKADEPACKPDPVPRSPRGSRGGGHPSRPAVAGRLQRPTRRLGRAVLERLRRSSRSLLALLRVGFTQPPRSPGTLVVSYTTVSHIPPSGNGGGLFSVALSRGSPRVAASNHPALRSPAFPRAGSPRPATALPARPRKGW